MPELSSKSLVLKDISSAEEGVVMPSIVDMYEVIQISSKQLHNFVKQVSEMATAYAIFATRVDGVVQEFVKSQQRIAETLAKLTMQLSVVDELNLVIRGSYISELINSTSALAAHPPSLQIFVQPNQPYKTQKLLPLPKRKQKLQLTEIAIEGNGFSINGEYIKGMTRDSKTGSLFELMIRGDISGIVPDDLSYEVTDITKGDYRALGFVIRDLKEILKGNKVKLDLKRYRGIGKYKVKAITKYIRKPKSKKKLDKTIRSN